MKKNSNLLIYFLTHFLFLGGGFARICELSNTDAWIAFCLGTLLGIIILYIINKVSNDIPLKEYLKKNTFLNIIIKLVYFIYILFNLLLLFVFLSVFLYSYFLPFTPSLISGLPFILLACFLSSKKMKGIYNVGFILIFISLTIVIIKTLLLTNEFHYDNLLPILTVKTNSIFKASIIYAVISTCPILVLLNEKLKFKSSLKYYLLSSLTNIVVVFTITLILGEMINVYSYPEYIILRKISFFKFIENIENFICVNWFFDLFISLTLFITKMKDTLCIKSNIIPFSISFSLLYIVNTYFSNNFYNTIILYKLFPYICGCFLLIIIILFSLKKSNNKNSKNNHTNYSV